MYACMSTIKECRIYIYIYFLQKLYYTPEGRGFDSRSSHWNFLVTILPIAPCTWRRLSL